MKPFLRRMQELDGARVGFRYDRSDRFRLHEDSVVGSDGVTDKRTDTGARFDPFGLAISQALALESPPSLGDLATATSQQYGIAEKDAFERITRYIAHLDHEALLVAVGRTPVKERIRRHVASRGVTLFVADWVTFARGGRSRRYDPTGAGLLRAVTATQWIVPMIGFALGLVVLLVTALVLGLDQVASSDVVQGVIAAPVAVGLVHLVLVYVHEAGHLLTAFLLRGRGTAPRLVVARGRKLGIVRQRGSRLSEIIVSASGPLAAAMVGTVATLGLSLAAGGQFVGMTGAGVVTSSAIFLSLAHLLSLLPFAADGENILKAVRVGHEGSRPGKLDQR